MKIEVSLGEIVDKLSILAIKKDRISDPQKLQNVKKEHDYLELELNSIGFTKGDTKYQELLQINLKLWEIEDRLREMESIKKFDQDFIELARQVYKTNDNRAEIKKQINLSLDSHFVEEKSYKAY